MIALLFSQKHPFNPSKFLMMNKYWSFGFSQGGLKAQQHIARASEATPWVKARSLVTPCKGRSFISISNIECFCPFRASILWQSVTQGVASLALAMCCCPFRAHYRLYLSKNLKQAWLFAFGLHYLWH